MPHFQKDIHLVKLSSLPSSSSAYDNKSSFRSEANFINEIIGMLEKKLRRSKLDVANQFIVGIDDRIYWLHSWINNSSSTILVLYGIGGVGKTTTAKCIYNSIFHKFIGSCFLAGIREMFDQSNGAIRMQSQLVSALLRTQKDEIIWNVHEGALKVKEALRDRDVLIVLDDVSDMKQLDELLGTSEFTAGSKIIITTRKKELLYAFGGHCQGFAIRELDDDQSMELFSLHAFGQHHPLDAYKDRAEVIVRHAGGLPLALKVLGGSLRGKSVEVWEDSLRKLEEIPNSDIQKTLKVSYESLQDDKDKDLFLHIACFFIREDKHDVIRILEQCGLYPTVGIDNLIHHCLLDIEENNLVMHELLQKMGKEIVRQESPINPGKRSRLWQNEDSYNVLKEKNGTRTITGLSLDMKMLFKDGSMQPASCNIDDVGSSWYQKIFSRANRKSSVMSSDSPNKRDLKISAFESMDDLMLLRLNYARLFGSYQKLPKKLRWLCWHGFPSRSLPSELPFDMLVSLEMSYSKLQRVWKGTKFLGSLKILNLSYSDELLETPDFRGLPYLQKLVLKGCVSLLKVCESITHLEGLVWLDLEGCGSLRFFPRLPTSLVTLLLSNMSNLNAFTQGKWWGFLPRHLVRLEIRNSNLTCDSFPRDFSHLVALECLDISYNSFTALPQCVGSLPSIRDLKVHHCSLLQSLHGLPRTLESLDISDNGSMVEVSTVPDSITFLNYVACNLTAVRGYFKSAAKKDVDRKISRYIGLESISLMMAGLHVVSRADLYDGNGRLFSCKRDDPIQVWFEFGIFSTSVPGDDLPDCYMFKTMGSQIAFKVPSVLGKPKVGALNVSFICRSDITLPYHWTSPQIHIYNRTKGLNWVYIPSLASFKIFGEEGNKMNFLWLSLWKCGDLLEEGDEVYISIGIVLTAIGEPAKYMECDECCVNLVYEDMILEEASSSKNEPEKHKGTCQLSFTDKLLVEISDYVHKGKTYYFSSYTVGHNQYGENVYADGNIEFVDWLGPKARSNSRYFNGGLIQNIKFTNDE